MPVSAEGLVYSRRGAGKPLVLVHGVGSRKEVWNPVADALTAERDVIAVDLPGFGATPRLGKCGVYRNIDIVEALIEELGLDKPDVGGNSMGGGIALELARRRAAGRAIAFSPIGFWDTAGRIWCQQSIGNLYRVISRIPRFRDAAASPALVPLLAFFYGKPTKVAHDQRRLDVDGVLDSTGIAETLDSFADYQFTDPDELADVPVTVAWGSRDVVLTYWTQAARARKLLPHAQHVTIPGAGHVPFGDDPATCVNLLLDR